MLYLASIAPDGLQTSSDGSGCQWVAPDGQPPDIFKCFWVVLEDIQTFFGWLWVASYALGGFRSRPDSEGLQTVVDGF